MIYLDKNIIKKCYLIERTTRSIEQYFFQNIIRPNNFEQVHIIANIS